MPKCSGPLADKKGTSQSCLSTQNKNGRRRSRFKTRVYLKMRREAPPLYGQTALFKNGHHVILQKGTALAPPSVSLLGLGGKNCTARDKSPAAPDGAGDFPSSLRRVSESIDTGYLHFMVFPYNTPPGGGVGRTPFSNCLRGLYGGTSSLFRPISSRDSPPSTGGYCIAVLRQLL